MKIGSFQGMKSLNRSIVLNKIRTEEPISRAHIARDTKLTPPTVSKLVNELLADRLIIESEIGESLGGRKPTMLKIDRQQFFVIGLDIGSRYIRMVVCNLIGEQLTQVERAVPTPLSNEILIQFLLQEIEQLMATHQGKEIVGIGIGMHGAVDPHHGISLYAPSMNLHHVPLQEELEKHLSIPVTVDNDVRALAFGEYWFGKYEHTNSMVTINLGYGVGAGMVVDGKLFHGANDLAGEIGHMTVDLSGKPCSCGNIGCWQTLISGPAITETAKQLMKTNAHPPIKNEQLQAKALYDAACNGDSFAIEVFEKTGTYIGVGLVNLIHLLNPETIILAGGVTGAKEFLLPQINKMIQTNGLTEEARMTNVHFSQHGKIGTALGAASLVLAKIFLDD